MSATAQLPVRPWVRSHRSAVIIAVVAVALATTLALLILRVGARPTGTSTPVRTSTGQGSAAQHRHDPAGPSYVPPLQRINEGCSIAHFGVPC